MEEIGTKPIDTFTIQLEHDPNKYLVISDKNVVDLWDTKLHPGSVWRVEGKQYEKDYQCNHYVFRRIDYNG